MTMTTITNTHKTRDAAAYLYLAQVAADLRLSGARHVGQALTASGGSSDLMLGAIITGTHAAAERIVQQITDDAKKRGFCLHRVNGDQGGLDSHEHEVRFYLAVDPKA